MESLPSTFDVEKIFGSLNGLFKLANTSGSSMINFDEARRFFPQYGLSQIDLGQMWKFACGASTTMDQAKFVRAMQFIYKRVTELAIVFQIGKEDRQKYEGHFASVCKGKPTVTNTEARNFFVLSKLPMQLLTQIWSVSDTSRTGTLKKEDFIIAMHLINTKLKNPSFQIPLSRPVRNFPKAPDVVGGSIQPIGGGGVSLIPTKRIDPMANIKSLNKVMSPTRNPQKIMTPTEKRSNLKEVRSTTTTIKDEKPLTTTSPVIIPQAENMLPPLDQLGSIPPPVQQPKTNLPSVMKPNKNDGGGGGDDDLPKPPLPRPVLPTTGLPRPSYVIRGTGRGGVIANNVIGLHRPPMPVRGHQPVIGGVGIVPTKIPSSVVTSVGGGGVEPSLPHPRVHSLREEVADLHQKSINLSRTNLRMEGDSQRVDAQIERLEAERDELKETVDTQVKTLDKLRKEKLEHDQKLTNLRTEIIELSRKRNQHLMETQALQREILRIEPILNATKGKKKTFDDEVKIYEATVDKEMTRLRKLKIEIDTCNEEYEKGPELVDRARQDLEETRREALEKRKELLQIKEDVYIQRELVKVINFEKQQFDRELKLAVEDLLEVKKIWQEGEDHLTQEKHTLSKFEERVSQTSLEFDGMAPQEKSSTNGRIQVARQFCEESEKMLEGVSKLMLEEELKMKRIREEFLMNKRKEAEDLLRKKKLLEEERLKKLKQKQQQKPLSRRERRKQRQLQKNSQSSSSPTATSPFTSSTLETSATTTTNPFKTTPSNLFSPSSDTINNKNDFGDDDNNNNNNNDDGWGDDPDFDNVFTPPPENKNAFSTTVPKKPLPSIKVYDHIKVNNNNNNNNNNNDDDGWGNDDEWEDIPVPGRKKKNKKKKKNTPKKGGGGGFDEDPNFGFDSPTPTRSSPKSPRSPVSGSSIGGGKNISKKSFRVRATSGKKRGGGGGAVKKKNNNNKGKSSSTTSTKKSDLNFDDPNFGFGDMSPTGFGNSPLSSSKKRKGKGKGKKKKGKITVGGGSVMMKKKVVKKKKGSGKKGSGGGKKKKKKKDVGFDTSWADF